MENERFWNKVDASGDCWEWLGGHLPNGYGRFFLPRGTLPRRAVMAHRHAWQLLIGDIPDGLEIDHLCRNRGCLNPDHLEVVTHRVNTLRGEGPPAKHARKKRCHRGHVFTEANTYMTSIGGRRCRTCAREGMARYYQEVTTPKQS